jgi:hypothetical protein
MHISKLDAASRQLHKAVQMFLNKNDPVSIHTLGSAAQEMFESLCRARKIKSLKSQILETVREERQNEFGKKLNEAKNFFKHANRDSEADIKFNPDTNEFVLWDAVQLYYLLTKQKEPLFVAFLLWMYAKNPEFVILNPEQKMAYDFLTKDLDPNNRSLFLQKVSKLSQGSNIN